MSHIYPLAGQKHFDIDRELTELGGERSKNFRIAYAWDGEHFFEVTDDAEGIELFEGWLDLHGGVIGGEPSESGSGDEAASAQEEHVDASAAPAEPAAQTAGKSATKSTPSNSDESTEKVTSEPPVESTEDATADAQETAETAEETSKSESSGEPKADSTTSGTARKRSAKNSNRRS